MNRLYTTTITLLLDTASEDIAEVLKQLEFAMYAACTELEQNKISPTFKIKNLVEI